MSGLMPGPSLNTSINIALLLSTKDTTIPYLIDYGELEQPFDIFHPFYGHCGIRVKCQHASPGTAR